MRKGNLLFSAVQFLIITALFLGGAFFLGLHFIPNARICCAEWILDSQRGFFFLGGLTTATAFFLTVCFWMMQKGQYLRIAMQSGSFEMEEKLVRAAVHRFWQESFPQKPLPSEIYVARQKVEIITPNDSYDLREVEGVLGQWFSKQFGYERSFFVTFKE